MQHRDLEANGITLHYVALGDGPAVVFCHGFPAIWSSWKSQMQAVARAGFRALAPDMRGCGHSSIPADAADYTPYDTVGDLVAILDAEAIETACVVGHDWGANVAWHAAMMRPDRFRAVAGLSVQYRAPSYPGFLDRLRAAGQLQFYMFEQIKPESDHAWADAAMSVPAMMYWTSGEPPEATRWDPFDPAKSMLRPVPEGGHRTDREYLAEAIESFQRTGFHGALNYYRALDPFSRHSMAFKGSIIRQPSMFLAGALDGLNSVALPNENAMRKVLPGLRSFTMLDGVGHWPQFEATDKTNSALIEFLQGL